jgi:hypothetical protein
MQDRVTKLPSSGSVQEGAPQWVTAPYAKDEQPRVVIPSNAGTVKTGVNLRGPPRKAPTGYRQYEHGSDEAAEGLWSSVRAFVVNNAPGSFRDWRG